MKKFLSAVLSLIMILSLARCGSKAPSAEELLAGARDAGSKPYQRFSMDLSVKSESEEGSGDVSAKGDIEIAGQVVHMDGFTMSVAMSGLAMDISMDIWADNATGRAYAKTSMLGMDTGWVESGTDGTTVDASGLSGTLGQFTDGVKDLSVRDHKKGEDWVLAGKLDMGEFSALGETVTDSDLSGMTGDVVMRFDEKDRTLKSMELTAKNDGMEFYAAVTVLELSDNKSLFVPQDVIDSAVQNDAEGFYIGGDGFDDSFGGYGDDAEHGYAEDTSGMFDRGGFDFGD